MEQSDSRDDEASSSCYEFDAPSRVIDFKALDDADNADSWFEEQASGADAYLATPIRHDLAFGGTDKPDVPTAVVTPHVKKDMDAGPKNSSPPSNIVTSWGDAQPKRKTSAQPTAQPSRVLKRKEATSGPAAPPVKKHRSSESIARVRPFHPRGRSSANRPARRSSVNIRRSGRRNSRAVPKTRDAVASTSAHQNTSEEQELERIRNLQKEVAEHRKRNEASFKAALAGSQPTKKLALSTTVPKEFHFSTDARVKTDTASSANDKEGDFVGQLRKHAPTTTKALKGATVPKPFNLSTGNKRKVEESAAYVPMAQQIEQFERRTPTRYHLRSRQSQERGPSPVKSDHLKITQPHTPQLMTRQRSRPATAKSSAELEAEEVEKLNQFKFKALELNRKILENALKPKKPAVKEPTVPEGFKLQIEKRLQERQTKKPQEAEEKPGFHAQPLPTKMLEGVVGVPEKRVLHPTVPESPAFALKKRVRMDHKVEEVKQPSPVKAKPVPHFGLPFQPRLPEKNNVEVCPFSFEERERERRALKEKRLEGMRNEEAPKFKAQPLPDFDAVVLPPKKVLEPTKPEPFRLLIDERGATKTERWEQTLKEEQKRQEEAAIFKARPNNIIHKEPFQPKKESRPALVAEPFELSTERRAREWQEFERLASEKEAIRARLEEEQRREEEEREKEEIAKMRQEQVHKAQPIRRYKPVSLKKSDMALTVPQSPNFSDRFRL
ncbi:targeting protein for Xklp2 isoform X2 [Myripristis murdjan]|uniref:targeting protein for Xklp2 isoform X2 n=1 Tax=Myripristis murdjan TaxID=586833 RepID=UPI001175FB5C|nr:targeting protein for Xklp2 isoform X2 [Myripristis murdjan]